MTMETKQIAHIESAHPSKFGVPRQSGLAPSDRARIVFEPEFRNPDALRGIEGFSHLWVLWIFSQNSSDGFRPTVRPPKLGGNERVGVFATRSPYRPNPIGLSVVKIEKLEPLRDKGLTILVSGADMTDGTPVLDIKPYLPYADSIPTARGGFADEVGEKIAVDFPDELLEKLPPDDRAAVAELLALDPRPGYQDDPERVYGMEYRDYNIRFVVKDSCLTVVSVDKK